MARTPSEVQHAARVAARRVEKLLIDMLDNNEIGEVAVVVSWSHLEPLKRVVERDGIVKIGRGRFEAIETK